MPLKIEMPSFQDCICCFDRSRRVTLWCRGTCISCKECNSCNNEILMFNALWPLKHLKTHWKDCAWFNNKVWCIKRRDFTAEASRTHTVPDTFFRLMSYNVSACSDFSAHLATREPSCSDFTCTWHFTHSLPPFHFRLGFCNWSASQYSCIHTSSSIKKKIRTALFLSLFESCC